MQVTFKVIRPTTRCPPPWKPGRREVALTDRHAEGTCRDALLPSRRPCGTTKCVVLLQLARAPQGCHLRQNRQPDSRPSRHFLKKHHELKCVQSIHIADVVMKVSVLTATIILFAYASVGEAQLRCAVTTQNCAPTVMPSGYVCYSCAFTTPAPGTFAGGCDNSVTTGVTSCTATKAQIQALYPGCTW